MPTINELQSVYTTGKSLPSQIAMEMLDVIEQSNLNCFITVDRQQVVRDALAADCSLMPGSGLGALQGIPVAVKDLIDVEKMPTTMASEQYAHNVAQRDAAVVSRLKTAGAIVIGKANTHQFAYGSSGDRSAYGAVLNPHDPRHMSGGSSSGSAAAVAAGFCVGALGTDTSGSVRLPAALCGVVGMKPTYGLVSCDGVFPLSPTLDHVGQLTSTVRDNAIFLEVMTDTPCGTYSKEIGASIEGRVVGVPTDFYSNFLSPPVAEALKRARRVFELAGATVVDLDITNIWDIYNTQQLILRAEAFATHREALSAGAIYDPEIRTRLMTGADVDNSTYQEALAKREQARSAFDTALASTDILLTATCGIVAPRQNERESNLGADTHSTPWLLTRLTAPTSLSGHPCISVPFGASKGLPIGMQLIGRYQEESTLYKFATILEEANSTSNSLTTHAEILV